MTKNRPKLWFSYPKLPGMLTITILMAVALPVMGPPIPSPNAVDDPLRLQKSQVYDVYGEYSIRGTKLHKPSICRMLNTGIKKITRENDPNLAWRKIIRDDDIVALKFTRFGDINMGINTEVASALLESLFQAGFKPKNFMLVGLTELPPNAGGTIPWKYGWQDNPIEFGSDSDYIAQWVDQVTAIINIPTIMDDNIIGLRGAIANVTWPLLKRPARFYISQGDPFMAEIYEMPQIKN
ncbi:MAG: hypothetical protein K9M57_00350, partial [Phycisphaerae bacterium]|nr:hypothetical protein [Phycisphaerae bacterium]